MQNKINELWEQADETRVSFNRCWEHHPPKYDSVMCLVTEECWTRSFKSQYSPKFALVFKIICTRQFGEYILTGNGLETDVNLNIPPSGSHEEDFLKAAQRAEYFLCDLFQKASEDLEPLPF